MRFLLALLLCCASNVVIAADEHVCMKNPLAKWGCSWTKGVVNDSVDAGDVISIENDRQSYILDVEPDDLHDMIGEGGKYIPGEYLFCRFPPRVHQGSGEEWSYGCVESFKNVTVIAWGGLSVQALGERVCRLVDCSKPGFAAFRQSDAAR